MLEKILKEKDYIPVMKNQNGEDVTPENLSEWRKYMFEALCKHSYGWTKPNPISTTYKVDGKKLTAYAGKVIEESITVSFETDKGVCSFPAMIYIPKKVDTPPVILHLAFRPVPDMYIPIEEITDHGFAVAVVCYKDMMNDEHYGDFSGGIGEYFGVGNPREDEEWGKIGMWAYGASRLMDCLMQRDDIDTKHIAVMGHSRLGKTALWTAAQDERFFAAISNNSGYGGAASSKKGKGERVSDFLRLGSWDWYCENFKLYGGELEDFKPYDQSFLLALIAPRYLCVGSAVLDKGADPEAEFLTTLHASPIWSLYGKPGLVCPDRMPTTTDSFDEGSIHYHLREGMHFLSREDWVAYIKFLKTKIAEEK